MATAALKVPFQHAGSGVAGPSHAQLAGGRFADGFSSPWPSLCSWPDAVTAACFGPTGTGAKNGATAAGSLYRLAAPPSRDWPVKTMAPYALTACKPSSCQMPRITCPAILRDRTRSCMQGHNWAASLRICRSSYRADALRAELHHAIALMLK